jgi:hypothetical protein
MPGGISPFAAVGIGTFLGADVASLWINRHAPTIIRRYGRADV